MNMDNKLIIGIDINEILRARWLQFDRFYVMEFGEEGVPEEDPYVYDFFKDYKWNEEKGDVKMLKDDFPEDINPEHYKIDEKTGESPADAFLFKKEERNLSSKDVYNKFMYEDYLFEIFGSTPMMYKNMDVDINKFYLKFKDRVEFVIVSKENYFSIPPTMFFLSKCNMRFTNYKFCTTNDEMWENVNLLITTDPELLSNIPDNKIAIKIKRPYNKDIKNKFDILQLNDLTENEDFEKIINNSKKEKNERREIEQ